MSKETVDEVLSISARLKKSRDAKKNKAKMARGRAIASKRVAGKEKLIARARKAARVLIMKKITKTDDLSSLPMARKAELEKRLSSPMMQVKIDALAKKLLPKIRQAELDKRKSSGDN